MLGLLHCDLPRILSVPLWSMFGAPPEQGRSGNRSQQQSVTVVALA